MPPVRGSRRPGYRRYTRARHRQRRRRHDGHGSRRGARTRPTERARMNPSRPSGIAATARRWSDARIALAFVAVAVLVAGCGGGKGSAQGDVAAKVNGDSVTVAQVDAVVHQQRGVRPEQADAAAKQALERLIDQQLAVQKAQELKLDQEGKVVQQLEQSRRDVLARAYVEKVGEGAAKPTAEAVKQYYDEKPALFKERRIYNIQELAIEARPDQIDVLRSELRGARNINAFVDYLKGNSIRFAANQAVRAAEQLPLGMVDAFAKLKDGQAMLAPSPTGAQVIVLAGSRLEPVDEARARPAIEQYLLSDAKRKLVEADLKALRAAAKIEYTSRPADPAASAATPAMPAASSASGAK
ncbi:MAG: EpsD family peptidyl-prolyl cis-trans isomerase [Burkholderiaceae bacterium]